VQDHLEIRAHGLKADILFQKKKRKTVSSSITTLKVYEFEYPSQYTLVESATRANGHFRTMRRIMEIESEHKYGTKLLLYIVSKEIFIQNKWPRK